MRAFTGFFTRAVLPILLLGMVVAYQNCGNVAFTTASSKKSDNNNSNQVPPPIPPSCDGSLEVTVSNGRNPADLIPFGGGTCQNNATNEESHTVHIYLTAGEPIVTFMCFQVLPDLDSQYRQCDLVVLGGRPTHYQSDTSTTGHLWWDNLPNGTYDLFIYGKGTGNYGTVAREVKFVVEDCGGGNGSPTPAPSPTATSSPPQGSPPPPASPSPSATAPSSPTPTPSPGSCQPCSANPAVGEGPTYDLGCLDTADQCCQAAATQNVPPTYVVTLGSVILSCGSKSPTPTPTIAPPTPTPTPGICMPPPCPQPPQGNCTSVPGPIDPNGCPTCPIWTCTPPPPPVGNFDIMGIRRADGIGANHFDDVFDNFLDNVPKKPEIGFSYPASSESFDVEIFMDPLNIVVCSKYNQPYPNKSLVQIVSLPSCNLNRDTNYRIRITAHPVPGIPAQPNKVATNDLFKFKVDNEQGIWTPIATPNFLKGRGWGEAHWTGSKMILWGGARWAPYPEGPTWQPKEFFRDGGIYDPATNSWSSMAVLPASIPARYRHASVFTGSKLIIWGGEKSGWWDRIECTGFSCTQICHKTDSTDPTFCGGELNNGAVYDVASNTWTLMNGGNAPSARTGPMSIWTGSRMFLFGGAIWSDAGGAHFEAVSTPAKLYDPVGNMWSSVSTSFAPAPRFAHSLDWTGTEAIVFGGLNYAPGGIPMNSGGIYNPSTNTWRMMAPAPYGMAFHSHVYDPVGKKLYVFGKDPFVSAKRSMVYDLTLNSWQTLSSSDPYMTVASEPFQTIMSKGIWTGFKRLLFGGLESVGVPSPTVVGYGAVFDPQYQSWDKVRAAGGPGKRAGFSYVWTGDRMILWSGQDNDLVNSYPNTGFIYLPE